MIQINIKKKIEIITYISHQIHDLLTNNMQLLYSNKVSFPPNHLSFVQNQ